MDTIREYLIGVLAAALICGIVTAFVQPKGALGFALKLMAGMLLLLAAIRPWVSISWDGLLGWTDRIVFDGSEYIQSGQMMAGEAYREGIKQQIEAYIVDEAKNYGCDLSVEIVLSEGEVPIPMQVCLRGDASPYAKQSLTSLLAERLGIPREDQIWT